MVTAMLAVLLQVAAVPPVVPSPPPPPPVSPFTPPVENSARLIGARVNDEFKRCGDARTNSSGRYVDAFGTRRHSAEWKKAALAMSDALTVCRALRQALREQKDFLVDVVQNGTTSDAELAAPQLYIVSSELEGIEQYYATETPRYRELLIVGWGDPHCAERADAFLPASSICPKRPGPSK